MSRCSTLGLVVLAVGGGVWFDTAVEAQVVQQSMFVSVIRGGEPVLDMKADEFIVEEDGQAREVLRIERADVPMQVAILVDDSQGLAQNLSHVRNGLRELIDKLPDGQQIALITFGDHMTTVVDYTTSKERLKAAAAQYVPFSETSSYLMNAVAETAVDLDRRGAIRPIIVLVTSEGANSNTVRISLGRQQGTVLSPTGGQGLGYKLVLDVLRERMVAVHTLVVRGFGNLGTAAVRQDSRDLHRDQGRLDHGLGGSRSRVVARATAEGDRRRSGRDRRNLGPVGNVDQGGERDQQPVPPDLRPAGGIDSTGRDRGQGDSPPAPGARHPLAADHVALSADSQAVPDAAPAARDVAPAAPAGAGTVRQAPTTPFPGMVVEAGRP